MPHSLHTLLIGACALLAFTGAHAELYSWKDSNGKVIFSDRPPLDAKQATLEGDGAPAKDSKGTGGADDPRAAIAREEARKKKIQDTDKKQIKWRCTELEKQYQNLLVEKERLQKIDPNKAAVLQTDAENHKDTLEKMCK